MAESVGLVTYNQTRSGGVNADNVISDLVVTIPDNGWVTAIRLAGAAGYNETTFGRLCIWDSTGALLWSSPQQTWNTTMAERVATIPQEEAIRVEKNQSLRVGFWRDPTKRAQWGLTGSGGSFFFGGGDEHQAMTYTAPLAPPAQWTTNNNYTYNLAASVTFERNAKPLKGAWRPPTPVGNTGELNPYFSGTLPHAGAEIQAIASANVDTDSTGAPKIRIEPEGQFPI